MRTLTRTLVLGALVLAASSVPAADENGRLEFSGVAISTGGLYSNPVAAQVSITIDRWSTAAEHTRLMNALRSEGQRSMLDELQDLPPVGRIRVNANLGYDLRYAQQVRDVEGGQRIVIATDRPISTWEAIYQPRSVDYPFTFIEMHLTGDGRGEGRIVVAAKLTASDDGRFIFLENYDTQPVRLTEIRQQ